MVSTQPENPELSRLYTPLAPSFPATTRRKSNIIVKRNAQETPLPVQGKTITPGLNYLVLFFWGGGGSSFAPPLSYLWSSARAAHLIVSVQMNYCLPSQLLPNKWITDEENSCYPKNFSYLYIIFACGRSPCLFQPKTYEFYSTITYGESGQSFFWISCPPQNDLPELFTNLEDFPGNFYGAYFSFSLILKGLNIGQENLLLQTKPVMLREPARCPSCCTSRRRAATIWLNLSLVSLHTIFL